MSKIKPEEMEIPSEKKIIETKKRCTYVPQQEWRYKNTTLSAKMRHILETGEFHDVTFEVGDNKHLISAHKFVLVLNSNVFEAMFHGALAPTSGELISVPDIEPNPFNLFLKVR